MKMRRMVGSLSKTTEEAARIQVKLGFGEIGVVTERYCYCRFWGFLE
jgi:hypothetical protein